jgi:predicted adenine nucleotide alpha hydrolase (AANH) superfamily ATPase
MNILIHTCCADCLLNTIVEQLKEFSYLSIYFYNPNIHPKTEYNERLKALKLILKDKKNIKLVIPDYKPKEYFQCITSPKNRCSKCWELRLRKTFEYAKEHNIENVTTTLLTSHYQQRDKIIGIGEALSKEFGINFVHIERLEHIKHSGFYKQNYCGCCYSLVEKMDEKYKAN